MHSCFSTFSCYSNGHLHIQAVLAQPLWSTKKSAHKKLLIHRLSPETLLTFGPKRIGIFVCRCGSRSVGPSKRFERQLFQVNALQLGTCRQIHPYMPYFCLASGFIVLHIAVAVAVDFACFLFPSSRGPVQHVALTSNATVWRIPLTPARYCPCSSASVGLLFSL